MGSEREVGVTELVESAEDGLQQRAEITRIRAVSG
jgi:hypothetical protein